MRQKLEQPDISIFHEIYPKGEYMEILSEEIPAQVREKIQDHAFRYSLDWEGKSKPVTYFKIVLEPGSQISEIFGAKYDNEYTIFRGVNTANELVYEISDIEPSFYLFELSTDGKEMGRGGVRYRSDIKLPFVEYVESTQKGLGAGTERYYLMSALSRMFYGTNLCSSTVISPEAQKIWERFYSDVDKNGNPKERQAEIIEAHSTTDENGKKKIIYRYRLLFPK